MITWLLLWSLFPPAELKLVQRLEPVEEGDGVALLQPWSMDIDRQGRILLADVQARKVFVWSNSGQYLRSFGKEGRGPGEFTFSGRGGGGAQAYVSTHKDLIYVYDGAVRTLSVFNEQFEFQRIVKFNLPGGRVEAFSAMSNGLFMVYQRDYMKTLPDASVSAYNLEGVRERTFLTVEDKTFSRKMSGGKITGIVYHGYAPSMFAHYNKATGHVLAAYGGKPSFSLYHPDGSLLKTVAMKLVPREITREDQQEYLDQAWIKKSTFLSADFGERMGYFDKILPAGRGYLVYYQSKVQANIDGLWVDAQGKALGRLKFTCGEGGGLFGAGGRIMAVRADEVGDLHMEEVAAQLQ